LVVGTDERTKNGELVGGEQDVKIKDRSREIEDEEKT